MVRTDAPLRRPVSTLSEIILRTAIARAARMYILKIEIHDACLKMYPISCSQLRGIFLPSLEPFVPKLLRRLSLSGVSSVIENGTGHSSEDTRAIEVERFRAGKFFDDGLETFDLHFRVDVHRYFIVVYGQLRGIPRYF